MLYFFKILFHGLTDERLGIPPKFVKHIAGNVTNKAILKAPSGKQWHVSINKKGKNKIYFEDGWVKFMNDNSLDGNEFLIFGYNGKMVFEVQIFGENQAERTVSFDEPTNQEYLASSSKYTKKKKKHEKIPVEVEERERQSDPEDINVSKEEQAPQAQNRRLWKSFRSEFPYFKLTLTECVRTSFNVRIPMEFAREHLPRCNTKMEIQDSEGEAWQVWCNYNPKRYCFCGGWIQFVREKNLKKGDICFFELKKENKMYLTVFPSVV